jgi:hypothetical protein
VILVTGGVVRKTKRRRSVLAKPMSDTRLINDSTILSNLTRKPMAEPTWSRLRNNGVVT